MKRRTFLQLAPALACPGVFAQQPAQPKVHMRRIPSSGLGSWITFNVGDDAQARASCTEVMRQFFLAGGRMIDSSPMYGSSQPVIGAGLARLQAQAQVFSAEKVWTSGSGTAQVEASRRHWGVAQFDLLQVHNLLAWETQLPLLFEMKRAGQLRFVGITTSHGRRHGEVEQLMRTQPLDFVQISYSIVDREVEQRILPLARERGIAVIANRPFREGALTRQLQRHPLPAWAKEIDCTTWAQVVLKYIVTHPAITCAIPATSQPTHVRENMAAATGRMLDEAQRQRIAQHIARL
jgi:diketogulonate reductase-like aldo/keto reductase